MTHTERPFFLQGYVVNWWLSRWSVALTATAANAFNASNATNASAVGALANSIDPRVGEGGVDTVNGFSVNGTMNGMVNSTVNGTGAAVAGSLLDDESVFYLSVYAILSFAAVFLMFAFTLLTSWLGVRAAARVHRKMLGKLLRAPMSYFDITPRGQLINRFSGDIGTVDKELVTAWSQALVRIVTQRTQYIILASSVH